jgi:hypothetical protein
MNAFSTAPTLAAQLNTLAGAKTIVGHSLGCELTAFALNDFGLQVNHACLVDAAFAQECFDGNADDNLTAMRSTLWQDYPEELWAAHWHERFDATDARSTLTWRNRFVSALANADIQSFYSSTEDVLGEFDGNPTSAIIENAFAALGSFSTSPLGHYAWVVQEKAKGNIAEIAGVTIQGSDYGGWGFNMKDPLLNGDPVWYEPYISGGAVVGRRVETPAEIGTVTEDMLSLVRWTPLFKSGWGRWTDPSSRLVDTSPAYYTGPSWIFDLYARNSNGSNIAADPAKNTQLLAQAIPALSLPVGANFCKNRLLSDKQFNMPQIINESNWPVDRGIDQGTGVPIWHHSDVAQVAFPYLYKVFIQLVSISNQ